MGQSSVQQQWDRFERWARHFRKSCLAFATHEAAIADYLDPRWMCCMSAEEVSCTGLFDFGDINSLVATRLGEKVQFLRGYLVDISFDGPDAMAMILRNLCRQYPSRCNNSLAIWFSQSLEGEVEPGSYFGFHGTETQLFTRTVGDIDFASVQSVLPYDWITVRKPQGICWKDAEAEKLVDEIRQDLQFDGIEFDSDISGVDSPLLRVEFEWV